MRLSVVEGAFYAAMVGLGETYFVANAVRLGASALEIALVVSLPLCVGALGPAMALFALPRIGSRRPWAVAMVVLQSLALLAVAALDWRGALVPASFILCLCIYQVGGLATAVAWNSWFGDLVPAEERGRYFARRSRVVQLVLFLSVIGAGVLLQFTEPTGAGAAAPNVASRGFLLLFLAAAAARLISAALLMATWEPRQHRPATLKRIARFVSSDEGGHTVKLLLGGASLQLVTYIASPFFVPFMLEELQFSYLEYMAATVTVMVGKFLLFPAWGRTVDRYGARAALMLAATMVAIVPLPWLFAKGLGVVLFAQLISGATWSGWEISFFSILVEKSVKRTRTYVFAAQSALNGTAQLLGGALGGLLMHALDRRFVVVFATSALLRLGVVAALPRLVPKGATPAPGRRELILRAIGFRASGGVVHRPVIVDSEDASLKRDG